MNKQLNYPFYKYLGEFFGNYDPKAYLPYLGPPVFIHAAVCGA